jgi:pimeloyl-ACP methyl ester carboxylesterase
MKKKLLFGTIGLIILIGAGLFVARDTNPLSHYTSDTGKLKFKRAYDRAMANLPTPKKTLDLKTSYGTVRVYYFDSGKNTKEPFVLLPGRSASTPMWSPNLVGLLKSRSVYTVDLINEAGMSKQTKAITNAEDQAKWLDEALTQLPESKLHLIGVSIGGWTATNYVVHFPNKVASLSLIDPVFVFDNIPLTTILISIPASITVIPTPIRNYMLSYISGGATVKADDPVAQLIETGMHTFSVKTPTPTRISKDQLRDINIPVFALMAGRSVMNDSETAVSNAQESLKKGTVDMIKDASHAINGEYADEVNTKIIHFVDTVAPM